MATNSETARSGSFAWSVMSVLLVDVLATRRGRRRGPDQAHDRRREEDDDQPVVERLRDQVREELLAGECRRIARRQPVQGARGLEQGLDRVVAQERRE